jgi:hypothetical protein
MKRNTHTPEHPAQPTDAKFMDAHAHVPRKHSRGVNKMLQHPAGKRASLTIFVRGGTGEKFHDPRTRPGRNKHSSGRKTTST